MPFWPYLFHRVPKNKDLFLLEDRVGSSVGAEVQFEEFGELLDIVFWRIGRATEHIVKVDPW